MYYFVKFFRRRNFSFNARNSALVAKSTLMWTSGMRKENRNDEGLFAGYWILDAGCWMLDAGCSMLDARCWLFDAGCPAYSGIYASLQLALLDSDSSLHKSNLCR